MGGEAGISLQPFDFQLSTVNLFAPNSFRLNVFADPHPLNPVASIFYKNTRGRGLNFPIPKRLCGNAASASVSANPVLSAPSALLPILSFDLQPPLGAPSICLPLQEC